KAPSSYSPDLCILGLALKVGIHKFLIKSSFNLLTVLRAECSLLGISGLHFSDMTSMVAVTGHAHKLPVFIPKHKMHPIL
ncbi:hypothetical protein DVA81_19675, partial [Acinetobacter baumannii]